MPKKSDAVAFQCKRSSSIQATTTAGRLAHMKCYVLTRCRTSAPRMASGPSTEGYPIGRQERGCSTAGTSQPCLSKSCADGRGEQSDTLLGSFGRVSDLECNREKRKDRERGVQRNGRGARVAKRRVSCANQWRGRHQGRSASVVLALFATPRSLGGPRRIASRTTDMPRAAQTSRLIGTTSSLATWQHGQCGALAHTAITPPQHTAPPPRCLASEEWSVSRL